MVYGAGPQQHDRQPVHGKGALHPNMLHQICQSALCPHTAPPAASSSVLSLASVYAVRRHRSTCSALSGELTASGSARSSSCEVRATGGWLLLVLLVLLLPMDVGLERPDGTPKSLAFFLRRAGATGVAVTAAEASGCAAMAADGTHHEGDTGTMLLMAALGGRANR